jgi:hypothetical protein
MDLLDINLEEKANEGGVLELEHPVTGEPLLHDGQPMTITLAGIDSAAYRNKHRQIQNRRLQRMARGRKPDLSNADAEACELLAACTISWSGIVKGGEALECSEQAARELYEEHDWIREQVDVFVGDRANFFPSA